MMKTTNKTASTMRAIARPVSMVAKGERGRRSSSDGIDEVMLIEGVNIGSPAATNTCVMVDEEQTGKISTTPSDFPAAAGGQAAFSRSHEPDCEPLCDVRHVA